MDSSSPQHRIPLNTTLLTIPPSLSVEQDGGMRPIVTSRTQSSVVEKCIGPIHRKGTLGYALEEDRSVSRKSLDVVQFLSRSWSTSTLQAFRTISEGLDCELELNLGDDHEKKEERDCKRKEAPMSGNGRSTTWMQRSVRRLRQSWVDMIKTNQAMNWMREKICPRKREGRKEEMRIHAAISVAGVAAALASLSSKSALGNTADKKKLAIAAAAALVAAQCADVAELMGAHHQHVSSIIRSAVSVATPTDILALTAAAATSLEGAPIGRGRLAKGKRRQPTISCEYSKEFDFTRNKEILAEGTELPTSINNRKTKLKIVHVYAKLSLVIARVRTKHVGGAFTTFKDYTILEVADESKDGKEGAYFTNEVNGYCVICIRTPHGSIHVTFKDDEECSLWTATISQLLFLSKQAESLPLSRTNQFPHV
ncbi:VAN3-binding protein-like [Magnolia sinica]|uniref:VAN3-binding protein-like n=1 Tax=Magnolia sinica TaxID=86752 RepID=UPI00265A2CD9|nr:VAN3-binding protein-like [Magnolia sinica]